MHDMTRGIISVLEKSTVSTFLKNFLSFGMDIICTIVRVIQGKIPCAMQVEAMLVRDDAQILVTN